MKLLIISILVCFPTTFFAQNKSNAFKIRYDHYENGKKGNTGMAIFSQDQMVYLSNVDDKIKNYIDLKNRQNISTITYENELFKKVTSFDSLPVPKLDTETQVVLGYKCQHAVFSYFSNRIDIWYTEKTIAKGSPYGTYLPNSNALVLKLVFNGNHTVLANAITKVTDFSLSNNFTKNDIQVSKSEFEEITINSRYTRLKVFENEKINFDPSLIITKESELQTNHVYHFSKGSVVMKKIKLTPELKNSGSIFAKLSCQSNGDAYDRTGSVFIVPAKRKEGMVSVLDAYLYGIDKLPVFTDNLGNTYQGITKEENYTPPIEILRFFTSFGVGYFNKKREINNYDWKRSIVYKEDVSSLIPIDEDEIWIGVFIGNYDEGGHVISLELDFYPSTDKVEKDKKAKFIEPLFSTVNTLEMSGQNYGRFFASDTLRVNFDIKENIKNLQLLYTTTGHGGWDGGDEFNPKLNSIFIDGKEVFKVIPWRTDCASYRLSNPASGNFSNGLSSSDLSRSNWCPATLTPPYIIPLTMLKKGKHVLEVVIDQGANEGSSINHWSVSGILVGESLNVDQTVENN